VKLGRFQFNISATVLTFDSFSGSVLDLIIIRSSEIEPGGICFLYTVTGFNWMGLVISFAFTGW